MKLFPFQVEGVKALVGKKRFLIASDPGLGKTVQLICAVNVLANQKGCVADDCGRSRVALEVLVVCPKSMRVTWEREIEKWGREGVNWTVVNHDKLITKQGEGLVRAWDVVIADESHQYLKNGDTKRARVFRQIEGKSDVVWLSTATPASKSAEDYYCTLQILLPGVFGGMKKYQFLSRYCNKVVDRWAHSGYKYEGFKNKEELKEIFKKCAIKHRQSEVAADLPELTYSSYYADVNYKDLMHLSESQAVEIKQAVMEDKVFGSDYNAVLRHNALLKVPAVVELLSGYPEDVKVVVFAWHREVVSEIVKALQDTDRTVDYITGEVSEEKRQKAIDAFQTGGLNTLVMNMQAGGVGITLTAATKALYVQFPYSAIHWIQSQKRVHRIGSKQPVQIIKIIIEKSIDEDVYKILQDRVVNIEKVGV